MTPGERYSYFWKDVESAGLEKPDLALILPRAIETKLKYFMVTLKKRTVPPIYVMLGYW